jgi:hypothetical protein
LSNAQERLRIDSSGTTTITATSGSSLQNGTLLLKTTNASNNAGLMFINSGNTSSFNDIAGIASFVESGDAKGNLRFWTRNSDGDNSDVDERMRITSSGNVGIGQTSPDLFAFSSKELHVKGGTGTNESASFIAESAQSASGFLGGYYWVNGSATNEFQKRVGQITVTAGTNADRSEMDFLVKQGAGNYSTAMQIDSSGNVSITTGNLILDSGAGIDFSDTADATGMTSELLDDYEEGTWTPVVRGSGTAGTYELSSSYAYYTKVGRLVTIHLSIGLDDPITGGGSGYTQITGLPYAKASGFHTTAVVNSIGFDYTGDYLITRFTTAGDTSTKLGIFGNVDNGSLSLTPISGLSAGDSFTITVSYLT